MSACNKFSESIFHMACRRSEVEIVDFILKNGGDSSIVDDYGRNVLHDVCWRAESRFDIATLILDSHLDLLFQLDKRNFPPLRYVAESNWLEWCAFLFHQKERYWPSASSKRKRTSEWNWKVHDFKIPQNANFIPKFVCRYCTYHKKFSYFLFSYF